MLGRKPSDKHNLDVMKKERPKILCLGVSYPCIAANLERQHGHSMSSTAAGAAASSAEFSYNDDDEDDDDAAAAAASTMSIVDRTIQLVDEKVLTQMDARDLARCQATEEHCGFDVFCVSQEQGAMYRPDRHLEANFNGRHFVKHLQQHFKDCQFDQIVLDYFWIPPAWNQSHWKRAFFEKTLVAFAQSRLLRIASRPPELLHGNYPRGVIYLPFCFHCFKEVVATFDKLSQFYNVSFLRKGELKQVALWSGTQTIHAGTMQSVFGKQLDQEEMYCTITEQQLKFMEEDPDISRSTLMEIASSLEDFPDIRFIVLEPLPSLLRRTRNRKEISGRFIGLVHPSMVKNGVGRVASSPPTRCETAKPSPRIPIGVFQKRAVVTPPGEDQQLQQQQHQPCVRRSERKRNLATAFEEDHGPQPNRKPPSTRAIVKAEQQPSVRRSGRKRRLVTVLEEDHHQQPNPKLPRAKTVRVSEQQQATRKSPRILTVSPSTEGTQKPHVDLPVCRPPPRRKKMQVQRRVNGFRCLRRDLSPDLVTDDLSHVDDQKGNAPPPCVKKSLLY